MSRAPHWADRTNYKRQRYCKSLDGTIRIWTLDAIPIVNNWELRDDNWVVDENGKRIMWLPMHLHTHLCWPGNVGMLNHSFHLKLHFGTEWNICQNFYFYFFHFLTISRLYYLVFHFWLWPYQILLFFGYYVYMMLTTRIY